MSNMSKKRSVMNENILTIKIHIEKMAAAGITPIISIVNSMNHRIYPLSFLFCYWYSKTTLIIRTKNIIERLSKSEGIFDTVMQNRFGNID